MWGATEGKRKLHLCSWRDVCKPKKAGGLGLRYAKDSNIALLSKLGWSLIHNRDELWVKILRSRYGCGNDLLPSVSLKQSCSNLWKGVCQAWPHVQNNLIWRVGDGHSIKFWT